MGSPENKEAPNRSEKAPAKQASPAIVKALGATAVRATTK